MMQPTYITSQLLEEDPGLIDLIDRFMTRLPAMRDNIINAWNEQDSEKFSSLLHQLKGVGGNYGYPALSAICAEIETLIREKSSNSITQKLKDFTQVCEHILAGQQANHQIVAAQ